MCKKNYNDDNEENSNIYVTHCDAVGLFSSAAGDEVAGHRQRHRRHASGG